MANVDGKWNTVVASPTGDQKAVLSVDSSGKTFTGTWAASTAETVEVQDGKVDGDELTWKVNVAVPVPMTLVCEATVDGDKMTGTVTSGSFGTFKLTGTQA